MSSGPASLSSEPRTPLSFVLGFTLLGLVLFQPEARAAEIIVTTTAGAVGGPGCSLRDAITAANNDAAAGGCPPGEGADVVKLEPHAEYELHEVDNLIVEKFDGYMEVPVPNGLPSLVGSIAIVGQRSVIRRATDAPGFRLVHVSTGAAVRLGGLDLVGGRTPDDDRDEVAGSGGAVRNLGVLEIVDGRIRSNATGSSGGQGGPGGAIFNEGRLRLRGTFVEENTAGGKEGGDGGAIWNTGDLVVEQSWISRNRTGGGFSGGDGAGMYNLGNLRLIDSVVSDNTTGSGFSSPGNGSGLLNMGSLLILRSTVSGNRGGGSDDGVGGEGAGLWNRGEAVLVNSTVSGNQAGGASAGIGGSGGGIYNLGTLRLHSCTVTDNRSGGTAFGGGDGAPGGGGGIANFGSVWLQNTILANNAGEFGPECFGNLISLGWNLIGDARDCTLEGELSGTRIDDYPGLGLLLYQGGFGSTHGLRPTSPALDAGDPDGCRDAEGTLLTIDQRGVPRTIGRRCDIGAFELGPCATRCTGDCSGDGTVSVDELVLGVQGALQTRGGVV